MSSAFQYSNTPILHFSLRLCDKILKLACLTFTQQGIQLAERIQREFFGQVDCFTKQTYKKQLPTMFESYQGLVFISSTGIAVRLAAPFLKDKKNDPAIVVVDDLGRYAISLVSGHVGGANALAQRIAGILDCQPIITTASDGRGLEAIDLFAQKHHLAVENWQDVKIITGMMVDGKPIKLISEIEPIIQYQHLVDNDPAGCIYVTSQEEIRCDIPYCILRPKNLSVGIGCRKGKTGQEILEAIRQVFQQQNLSVKSIRVLATVELKKDEPGILEACKVLGADLHIFTNEEIHKVQDQFVGSQFVQSNVGVTAVSEPCAYLSGGEMVVGKIAIHGVTIAVARGTL